MATAAVLAALVGALLVLMAPGRPAHAAADGFATKMLELVNQHRAAAGVAPLQWSDGLGRAAQDGRYDGCGFPVYGRATEMGARNYFSHTIQGCNQSYTHLLGGLGVQTSATGESIAWMNGTTDRCWPPPASPTT